MLSKKQSKLEFIVLMASLMSLVALSIATYIGKFATNSALPLFVGFLIFGSISIILIRFLKKLP